MFNLSASYQRKMQTRPGEKLPDASFKKLGGVCLTNPTPYSKKLVIFKNSISLLTNINHFGLRGTHGNY